jgi:two-component sensor histidine kinase
MSEPMMAISNDDRVSDLAAEANHRIANHLALLVSVLHMERKAIVDGPATLRRADVSALIGGFAGMIATAAHLHRKLGSQRDDVRIDLSAYLQENCLAFLASLGLSKQARISSVFEANCHVTAEQAQLVALIVTEVLTNAIKYAHPTGLPVAINFVCRHGEGRKLVVEIADDGIGLPEGFDPTTDGGTGFELIRALAKSARANLEVESDGLGTSFQLTFNEIGLDAG